MSKRMLSMLMGLAVLVVAGFAWADYCGMWLADPDPSFPGSTSAYSNYPYSGSCGGTGTYGLKYQCVEYAQRYYASRWGFAAKWGVNAKDMCGTHPSGITSRTSGLSACDSHWWHGDLIVIGAGVCGANSTYGHVAVVDGCVSSTTLSIVEQNYSAAGHRKMSASCAKCDLWTASNNGPYACQVYCN